MAQRRKLFGDLTLSALRRKEDAPSVESLPEIKDTSPSQKQRASIPIIASPSEASCEGALYGVEGNKIVGWAWDREKPDEPVQVELYIGDVKVGSGAADRFDDELLQMGLGDGMHRFEISLDRIPDISPPFSVRAVISGTEKELEPPIGVANVVEMEYLLACNEYDGRITGIKDGAVCGWVVNRQNPQEQPLLTLFDGDSPVLTGSVVERVRVVLQSGATGKAHRFELPLPNDALDGHQHLFSVRAGEAGQLISGSPIAFGPSDAASLNRGLVSLSEKVQQLDRRLNAFRPELDHPTLEREIETHVLDRLDMLLNIHRDAIERELAVLRRQVAELLRASGRDPDLISPIVTDTPIEEPRPTAKLFSVITRSSPLATFDLATASQEFAASGGLSWSEEMAGVRITDSGSLHLDGSNSAATLVIRGSGATDPLEFCGLMMVYGGRILTGRVDIGENGDWTLTGSTLDSGIYHAQTDGLAVAYLPDLCEPSGSLCLKEIAVFRPGRAPEQTETGLPKSVTVYLGPESGRGGWYPVETGGRGGYRWMAGHGEIAFRIRQTGVYRLSIPEIRPLQSDLMTALQVIIGGVRVAAHISPRDAGKTVFGLDAQLRTPVEERDLIRVRLSFPNGFVKSPKELGLGEDERPLTIAIRTASLIAVES